MRLHSYRHPLGHYAIVPSAEGAGSPGGARRMEFLGEMGLERFASDVQARIVSGGLAGSAFVFLSAREFLRVRGGTLCAPIQ